MPKDTLRKRESQNGSLLWGRAAFFLHNHVLTWRANRTFCFCSETAPKWSSTESWDMDNKMALLGEPEKWPFWPSFFLSAVTILKGTTGGLWTNFLPPVVASNISLPGYYGFVMVQHNCLWQWNRLVLDGAESLLDPPVVALIHTKIPIYISCAEFMIVCN